MDPVSSILTAASLVVNYVNTVSSKNETIDELRFTSSRLISILSSYDLRTQLSASPSSLPQTFSAHTLHANPGAAAALGDMQDILLKIYDNLRVWKAKLSPLPELWKGDKRAMLAAGVSLVAPGIVLGKLKVLQEQLDRRAAWLTLALNVAQDQRNSNIAPPTANKDGSPLADDAIKDVQDLAKSFLLDELHNKEVRRFWVEKIGPEVSSISIEGFYDALSIWLASPLEENIRSTLSLRLDEYALGAITPSSFNEFVGEGSIRDSLKKLGFVRAYKKISESKIIRPLIVWIDDEAQNVTYEMGYARSLGVLIIHLASTAEAKLWIETNEKLLRKADRAHRVRFITDNHRWESSDSAPNSRRMLDLGAGENILRYLRGRLYTAPVLVYTSFYGVARTAFVSSFGRVGSTYLQGTCLKFIDGVSTDNGSEKDDEPWRGCGIDPDTH